MDQIISAEIPDPYKEPEMFKLVSKHMIHRPCENDPGQPCRIDGKSCSKRFPKVYQDETTLRDGYPLYRRRAGGPKIPIKTKNLVTEIGNEYVVPYSKYLLKKYGAHINVEIAYGIGVIKYICSCTFLKVKTKQLQKFLET